MYSPSDTFSLDLLNGKKEENDNEALNYNNHVVQLQHGLFHF